MVISTRVELDVLIMNRIAFLNGKITGDSFKERLEELLWLRDQIKSVPYLFENGTSTGDLHGRE